jgi:rod shape-determining protein MreC
MNFIYTKTFVAFMIALVFVVMLLFLDTRGILDPVKSVFLSLPKPITRLSGNIVRPVKNFFATIFTLKDIVKKNAELDLRVADLEHKMVDYDQIKFENEILRAELEFKKNKPYRLVSCGVLALDPQGISDTAVISCGEESGVSVGEAIISNGYLVGTIIHVGKKTSTAILITNINSSIDARISGIATEGVVKGSFGSGVVLDLIPQNSMINKNDLVVTAGISDKVPKNILIGSIGETISRQSDLFKKAALVTPVKFHDLEFVFAVIP